jgi:hypothetical protein
MIASGAVGPNPISPRSARILGHFICRTMARLTRRAISAPNPDRWSRGTPIRFTFRTNPAAIRPPTGCAPLTGMATARELGAREKRGADAGTSAPLVIARDGPGSLQTARDRRAPQQAREATPATTPHTAHEVSPWTV